MNRIEHIEYEISELRSQLRNHSVYENLKNINDINDLVNTSHEKVTIEIREKSDFSQLKDLLKESGKTKVKIKIGSTSKAYTFELKNPRKFNFKTFSSIKDKEFIKKISF